MGSGIPFANNWAYLDTELSWLERLLLVAVSQQRKNLKSVARVAKTSSDKATSDWWQGLVAIKNRAYDDTAPKKAGEQPGLGYQKTLDRRIMLSRASKVSLGLPTMRTALGLSLFEKKLVLMTLAPEVQVRYGKLYHYLQTGTHCMTGALPTVELALRVLCRNETERRRARAYLSGENSLLQRQILRRVDGAPTLLGSQLQLAPEWVEYLLAESPDPTWPVRAISSSRCGQRCRDRLPWSELIVAEEAKQQSQTISAQLPSRLLLVGETGAGKEKCAIAITTQLKLPLYILDLAQRSPQDGSSCLNELDRANYPIILVKSAHHWLGRTSAIEQTALQRWLTNSSAHILFSVRHRHLVRHHWRQQLTVCDIPLPDADLRLQLWQQSFPQDIKGMGKVRWSILAAAVFSPRQILDIGQMTKAIAGDNIPTVDQLQQILHQQGYSLKLR